MIQRLGDIGIIGHNQPAGRAAQAFIRAHGHEMRALGQWVFPRTARDDAALMGGIKHHLGAHFVGDGADLGHRVLEQVQAAADGDQLWPLGQGQLSQRVQINAIARHIHRRRHAAQAIKPRTARAVVGHMPTNGGRGRDNGITGFADGHKAIEIGQCPRGHAAFCIFGLKHLRA